MTSSHVGRADDRSFAKPDLRARLAVHEHDLTYGEPRCCRERLCVNLGLPRVMLQRSIARRCPCRRLCRSCSRSRRARLVAVDHVDACRQVCEERPQPQAGDRDVLRTASARQERHCSSSNRHALPTCIERSTCAPLVQLCVGSEAKLSERQGCLTPFVFPRGRSRNSRTGGTPSACAHEVRDARGRTQLIDGWIAGVSVSGDRTVLEQSVAIVVRCYRDTGPHGEGDDFPPQ